MNAIRKNDQKVKLPKHHGQQMDIKIHSDIDIEALTSHIEKLSESSDAISGPYYLCRTCTFTIPLKERPSGDDRPSHHDEKMLIVVSE